MIQFTKEEILKLRKKLDRDNRVIDWLKNENKVVFNNPLKVPETGIATWNLYYFCPTHSVRLNWNIDKPLEHICPIDGEILAGEPYDGSWWRKMNELNAKASYHGGLLYQLTEDKFYLNKVRDILLEYAKYYPDYEEHGEIPYNGPGKANGQTLCEANCHKDFVLGYDLIQDDLEEDDKDYIKERLLREGANFLMDHRSDQLHNHEMKISGTIGLIGLIIEDEKYVDFAVNTKYGLKYQIENGTSKEGLWFEGSVHYHYYAVQGMLAFEKIARNSKFSNLDNPNFKKMLKLPLELLLKNKTFPKLNDCIKGQEELNHTGIFEFAYSYYKDQKFAMALNETYKNKPRNNIEAFLYGVDELPKLELTLPTKDIHLEEAGITIFREKNSYFLLKHSPYGGEHDHYDRLDMILYNNDEEIFHDLGTTGYGAILHYDYYKNTGTHNTIMVNGRNQPPVDTKILKKEITKDYKIIDTKVDWSKKSKGVDSFTRVQWCEESYKDVSFRRSIVWLKDHFIEVVKVENPHNKVVDYCLHTQGKIQNTGDRYIEKDLKENKILKYIVEKEELNPLKNLSIKSDRNSINIYSLPQELHYKGKGPGNPSVNNIDYLFLRNTEKEIYMVNLFDYSDGNKIKDVVINKEKDKVKILLDYNNQKKMYNICMSEDGIKFSITI